MKKAALFAACFHCVSLFAAEGNRQLTRPQDHLPQSSTLNSLIERLSDDRPDESMNWIFDGQQKCKEDAEIVYPNIATLPAIANHPASSFLRVQLDTAVSPSQSLCRSSRIRKKR